MSGLKGLQDRISTPLVQTSADGQAYFQGELAIYKLVISMDKDNQKELN